MIFPVGLNLTGVHCLVVGGGRVALAKARALRRSGARLTVVSPELSPGFKRLEARHLRRRFRATDLAGQFLAIAATDDPRVNRSVHDQCRRRGILVNVVDVPELCTFIVPSVVRRGPVTLSISTEGQSPALAKALRKDLERLYPSSLGRFARSVGRARRRIL
ncbi:MAG TPA: bifunctional precorrin-2 dehydrogenase/sirohydrochlorin ferrochelatase, partial [Planctomycetota bacterium]|nr:bifunctional precorrin-2 dehydrogenase/sirohydrochlorin ferrochelatase [Planctomycetota bacterium]